MSYRTKGYVLAQAFTYRIDIHDSIDLPAGSFVLPMDTRWVPKETKIRVGKPNINETYAYTKYGIIIIPIKLVRLAN